MPFTSTIGENPWAVEEWGVMSNMLSMATAQIGNPVALLVLMVADDRLLHIMKSFAIRS